jgi:hypothetical protein
LISRVRQGCVTEVEKKVDAVAALVALDAAEKVRASITAAQLADYVRAWKADLETWREFLPDVGHNVGIEEAINWLKIPARTVTAERSFRLFLRDGRAS